jgi:nicotinamide riboside transporter PnuC
MMDSIFSFTDLPIKMLTRIGGLGIVVFGILGLITFISKILGFIAVPGYTAMFLSIGFFGAINLFGLGIIGSYAWRTYENTKGRPLSVYLSIESFNDIEK